MSTNTPDTNESTELDDRTERALSQYLTVLPEAPDLYTVVSESGKSYTVDTREGRRRCTCPDHKHRGVRCKHLRRVAFATGARPIPAEADRAGVDEHLGRHVDGTPRVAATDGGVLEAGEDREEGGRPEGCDCGAWNAGDRVDLPCWPCYREGFDEPNPNAEE